MHANVTFHSTGFDGLIEIVPKVYPDERGIFFESFREEWIKQLTSNPLSFTQENQSFSRKGVIRGLHMQTGKFAQAKLVRVVSGRVLDVVVDLRSESPTFAKTFAVELDDKKQNQLFVPAGFAHGLAALEDSVFFYKCSSVYDRDSEVGVHWNDPDLNIDWPFESPIVSDKDKNLPFLKDLIRNSVL